MLWLIDSRNRVATGKRVLRRWETTDPKALEGAWRVVLEAEFADETDRQDYAGFYRPNEPGEPDPLALNEFVETFNSFWQEFGWCLWVTEDDPEDWDPNREPHRDMIVVSVDTPAPPTHDHAFEPDAPTKSEQAAAMFPDAPVVQVPLATVAPEHYRGSAVVATDRHRAGGHRLAAYALPPGWRMSPVVREVFGEDAAKNPLGSPTVVPTFKVPVRRDDGSIELVDTGSPLYLGDELRDMSDEEARRLAAEIISSVTPRSIVELDEALADRDEIERHEAAALREGECCFCNAHYTNYGNNPEPVKPHPARCCNACNAEIVIPARLGR